MKQELEEETLNCKANTFLIKIAYDRINASLL